MPEISATMPIYRATVWLLEYFAVCHICLRRVLFLHSLLYKTGNSFVLW